MAEDAEPARKAVDMTETPTALTDVTRALVVGHDVTDLLTTLLSRCLELVHADGAGLLVAAGDGSLELLCATSHRTEELEVYQSQVAEGPCVDVIRTGLPVVVDGPDEVYDRWPTVGPVIAAAGYQSVHAMPMRWRSRTVGGLNVFSRTPGRLPSSAQDLLASLADLAMLAVAQPAESELPLDRRISDALEGRVMVERAKGVLAQSRDLDMASAYDDLRRLALADGLTLTQAAVQVVERAQRR
jgi:GAF domain-containing protein